MDSNNFSSSSLHTTADSIGIEALNTDYLSHYSIPERYYINTLVLLPINPSTLFLYWEVCDDFILSKYSGEYDGFMIKIMEEYQGNTKEEISFRVYEQSGRYYVNRHFPSKTLYAIMGIIDSMGKFVELMVSNRIKTPSDTTSIGDEVWMEKSGEWSEIIRASLSGEYDHLGSVALVRELESARKYLKLRSELSVKNLTTIPSSGEFLGSSENMSSFGVSSYSFSVQNNLK